MPKLQNVTTAELKKLDDAGSDVCIELHDLVRRMEAGYCDELERPMTLGRSFLSLSRAAADMAAAILNKAQFDEMHREAEAAIRARKAV